MKIKSTDAAPLTEQAVIEKIMGQDSAPKVEVPDSEPQSADSVAPTAEVAPQEEMVSLSADELREIVEEQVRIAQDEAAAKIAELNAAAEQKAANLQKELEEIKSTVARVTDAARARQLLGRALPKPPSINTPMFNVLAPKSADACLSQGRLAEWHQIHDSAPTKQVTYDRGTRFITHRDMHDSFRYWLANRDSLRSEVETFAKASGFLLGSKDAATARTDIPEMVLTHLSNLMRVTHQTKRVYWQFPVYVEDFEKGPGDNVAVIRWANLAEPTAEANYTLTPGTSLATTQQAISETERIVTLEEKGLGKNGVANFEPIGLPEFWMARSIQNLERVVMQRLGQHYEVCVDHMIRTKYFTTTAIVYNDNGGVTITPGNVGTGDDGTMTAQFLTSLYGYMSGLQIPPMADGTYAIVMHSTAASQFLNSLNNNSRFSGALQTQDVTNLFSYAAVQGQVTGYLGSFYNFHIFETNAHSLGAAGTEGAQNVTLGVGSTLTRTSIAFGRDAVGHAVGMPVQIRRSNDDDFGRLGQFIWLSHETAATLDVNPNNNASEQLRVLQVRTVDTAL